MKEILQTQLEQRDHSSEEEEVDCSCDEEVLAFQRRLESTNAQVKRKGRPNVGPQWLDRLREQLHGKPDMEVSCSNSESTQFCSPRTHASPLHVQQVRSV